MLSAGIVDPAKVVRVALQDAASVAGLLITTEAMVAETPKKTPLRRCRAAAVWAAWAEWITESQSSEGAESFRPLFGERFNPSDHLEDHRQAFPAFRRGRSDCPFLELSRSEAQDSHGGSRLEAARA